MNAPAARNVLVVEGGGLRGAFCAGALSALDRLGYPRPDAIFATSAGAPSAAYLATGQIDRAVRLWENRTHAGHLVSPLHWLRRRPLMDIDKLVTSFKSHPPLDVQCFGNESPRLYISVTHCLTGEPHHLRMTPTNAYDLLTAAMALPLAYGLTVPVDGQYYVDGGITDSIPIERALSDSAANVLVVLTRPEGYRKRRSTIAESAFSLQYRRYPQLVAAFQRRAERYNETLAHLEQLVAEGRVSVLRPELPLPASRLTRDRTLILKTIQLGRDAARQWLSDRPLARTG